MSSGEITQLLVKIRDGEPGRPLARVVAQRVYVGEHDGDGGHGHGVTIRARLLVERLRAQLDARQSDHFRDDRHVILSQEASQTNSPSIVLPGLLAIRGHVTTGDPGASEIQDE